VNGIRDSIQSLEGNDRESKDGKTGGKDSDKACNPTPKSMLPCVRVVEVDSNRVKVHNSNHKEVDSHTKVSKSEIAHQKLGDRHLELGRHENDDDTKVANYRKYNDKPYGDSKQDVSHDILTWIEGIRFRRTNNISLGKVDFATEYLR
jgi:hypothetical protein